MYIVPGFRDEYTNEFMHEGEKIVRNYVDLEDLFRGKGYWPVYVDINWTRTTLVGWLKQVKSAIYADSKKHNPESISVIGFSFGAVTAAVLSADVKFKNMWLCSLSPYFKEFEEDMVTRRQKSIGVSRINQFRKLVITDVAKKSTATSTCLLYGSKEPGLVKLACRMYSKASAADLVVVNDANHNVCEPKYLAALNTLVEPVKQS